jgi:hypothetical protein
MRRPVVTRKQPTLGDTKLERKFAWFPTVVGKFNQFQVWLEYYAQYYVYDERVVRTKFGIGIRVKRWFPTDRDLY